jgi:excisionase family DNA binding protein
LIYLDKGRRIATMNSNNNHLRPDQRFLKAKDVAEIIGVHPSTVTRWADQGKIKHIKEGNILRFRESVVWEFFDNLEDKSVASLEED